MSKEVAIGVAGAVIVFLLLQGVDVAPFLFMAALIGGLVFTMRFRSAGKSFNVVGPVASDASGIGITFADVGGQETAKRELMEALQFVRDADTVAHMGIKPLRGVLLAGPPGTGKTLLAKAAASYVDAAFIAASGSQFIEMYAGVGAQRVRRLFNQAQELAQKHARQYAIVFIDELEVIGGRRGQHKGHLEYDQTLNELLVQMDGLATGPEDVRVIVIGATNRPDLLDPALVRPGRFDRTVRVDLPDKKGRHHILRIHAAGRPLADDVDLELLAKETYGMSGAHLESVINEAAIAAFRNERDVIVPSDIKEAIDKVMLGERLDRRPTAAERSRIAYHEAGHALLSELVQPGSVASVTITSRGGALGYMRQVPEHDPYLYTRVELLNRIAVTLAGAVAEQVFFGSRSTGSAGDFEQAMMTANHIINTGLSELGIVNPDMLNGQLRHEHVQYMLHGQELLVRLQIETYREKMDEIAAMLLDKEQLSGDEFRQHLGEIVWVDPPVADEPEEEAAAGDDENAAAVEEKTEHTGEQDAACAAAATS